jgi:hypothetical protein
MIRLASDRRWVVAALLTVAIAGCSHRTASAQVSNGVAPFNETRNQAVDLIASSKRSLDAQDVNTLAVAYTALQEKANAYASFIVEAVTTSSFDPSRNAKYASDFSKAIADFNKSYDKLEVIHADTVTGQWVPPFAQTLQTRWNEYNGMIGQMSPQTKADLIAQLKRELVWPNYEDIATEPVKAQH